MIEKLLCRFPNLKDVAVYDSFIDYSEFNDDICMTILQKCPKLDTFEIHLELTRRSWFDDAKYQEKQDEYLHSHCNLRLLLTKICLRDINFSLRPESSVEYLTKFPRLKAIWNVPDLNKFQKLLPVLGQLSNLTTIEMREVLDDQNNFAETYIDAKSKHEQRQLLKSLSAVKKLTVMYRGTFGVNSIQFIAQYFTGLKYFEIASNNSRYLTNPQQALLGSTIIDWVCKNSGRFTLYELKIDDVSKYLPIVVTKLFQNTSSSKVLHIKLGDAYTDPGVFVHLSIGSSDALRSITINVSSKVDLHTIARTFCSSIPLKNDIDTFTIGIDEINQRYNQKITTTTYDEFLTAMPSLKEIKLEIPQSYVQHTSTFVYPLIETITLQATAGKKTQEILDTLPNNFPNLKQLNLYYFCGIWHKKSLEYQITLPECSLESVVLDVTPAKFQMDENWPYLKNKFIVIQVSSNGQHLYKISARPFTKTSISENNLINFKAGDDYFRIHISVKNLRHLHVYYRFWTREFELKYVQNAKVEPLITLFRNQK